MNVIVISNRTSIQGHEYHVACLKRYISDEDWEEFLPYIRNSRSLDLYDLYHDIRQDCEAVLPRIKYNGKSYDQLLFRIRGRKNLKQSVSDEVAKALTHDVTNIARECLEFYYYT